MRAGTGERMVDGRYMGKSFPRLTKMSLRPLYRQKRDVPSTEEDHRSLFYEHYRKESEEYDEEFMTKYDEDLNTTLIFVSLL